MEIGIIGPGKVGTALGIAARRAGYTRLLVAGRDEEASQRGAQRIGESARGVPMLEAARADLVWLTVPDRSIETLADSIAPALRAEATLVHCSGAASSRILAAASERAGCAIAAAHPIQTFPTVSAAVADLPGSVWALEGDEAALEVIEPLLAAMGSRTLRIDPQEKAGLHVAAVMACNYLVALLDAAMDLAEPAIGDRQRAIDALLPIVEATVRNVAAMGPARALTGPIARGDLGTLARHAQELEHASPTVRAIYASLGTRALELAEQRGALDASTADGIRDQLRRMSSAGGGT